MTSGLSANSESDFRLVMTDALIWLTVGAAFVLNFAIKGNAPKILLEVVLATVFSLGIAGIGTFFATYLVVRHVYLTVNSRLQSNVDKELPFSDEFVWACNTMALRIHITATVLLLVTTGLWRLDKGGF